MLRALGAFLLLFSLLSLVVHLQWMCVFLGLFAFIILALSLVFEHADRHSGRHVRREPLSYR